MNIKRRLSQTAAILATMGFFGLLLVLYFKSGETRVQYWTTAKDLNPNGWLLLTPPRSARDIIHIDDIDTNEVWEIFKIDETDIKSVANGCQGVPFTELSLPRQPKKYLFITIAEWPTDLTINNTSTIQGRKMFRCTQPPPYPAWQGPNYYFIAIDIANLQVFAWNNDGG